MIKRFERVVMVPALVTLGVVIGLSFAMNNPSYQLVALAVIMSLAVWLLLEFILEMMLGLLFPVFDMIADRMIDMYNTFRPLAPSIKNKIAESRVAYWSKKLERQKRREEREHG